MLNFLLLSAMNWHVPVKDNFQRDLGKEYGDLRVTTFHRYREAEVGLKLQMAQF